MENIKIVGRHVKITDAISDYVNKRFGGMEKYVHNIISVQVILEVNKYRHSAEVILYSNKKIFKIKEVDKDLYVAIDKSANRIKELLIRHKEKIVSLKKHRKKVSEIFVDKQYDSFDSEETVIYAQKMIRADAIKMFEEGRENFFVFIDKETEKLNIVYKKNNFVKVAQIETY